MLPRAPGVLSKSHLSVFVVVFVIAQPHIGIALDRQQFSALIVGPGAVLHGAGNRYGLEWTKPALDPPTVGRFSCILIA